MQLFAGMRVSSTGLAQAERDKLAVLVVQHGGSVLPEMRGDATTHLVARHVGTHKYKLAVLNGIPVMLDCKSFLLGPFGGLAISISGFKGDERQRLVQDIEAGGGKYTGEMAQGQVTHLVVNAPSGSKFDFAVKTGGVKIVNAAWVRACVDMGAHKDEEEYSVKRAAASAVPVAAVTETPASIAVTEPAKDTSPRPTPPNVTPALGDDADAAPDELAQAVALVELSAVVVTSALRGCVVLVEGVRDDATRRKLQLMATALDAVVAWDPLPQVTHVALADSALDQAPRLRKTMSGALVVKCTWLLRCYEAQRRLACNEFACAVPDETPPAGSTAALASAAASNKRLKSTQPPVMASLAGLTLCVSMYVGEERREVERLAAALGATFTEKLTNEAPSTTVLVIKGRDGAKFTAALEWKLRYISNLEWLRQCARLREALQVQEL